MTIIVKLVKKIQLTLDEDKKPLRVYLDLANRSTE